MDAFNKPVRSHSYPALGLASQPVYGTLDQRSRSSTLSISSNAFRAPMAILSFCPATKLTGVAREVFSCSQAVTASCPLCPVRFPRSVVTSMLLGFVDSIPAARCSKTGFIHLEKSDCPEALKHFWSGHAPAHVSGRHVKLLTDRAYRLDWAERLGTGFVLPVGQPGLLHLVRKTA